MNRVNIDLDALRHNLATVNRWVRGHGGSLTLVTKALCGHAETIEALTKLGVCSIADSRISNLRSAAVDRRRVETWYLRPPHLSGVQEVVGLTDVSLNSELAVVRHLNHEAERQGVVHRVAVMIELGDLREGVLPGSLVKVYQEIFELANVKVIGIGANLGCLSGTVPSIDELMQLVLYHELLELKFNRELPLITAGTSAVLPLLLAGQLPRPVNHFRIGESILLGTNPVTGERLQGLRDVVTLEAEVVEIKEKSLVPSGETTDMTPFAAPTTDESFTPGQRGFRALVTVGQVDTEISALQPLSPQYSIAGASSDITVVNVGEASDGLRVGDTISFRPGYAAFVRLMANSDTEKVLLPSTADLSAPDQEDLLGCDVPPTTIAVAAGAAALEADA